MVASHKTIEQLVKVIQKHVDDNTFNNIVNDLSEVPGNESFRLTIQRLAKKLKK